MLLICTAIGTNGQGLKWKESRSAKRIKSTVVYLASDELEGRSTGSDGEKKSAEYIASAFGKLRLKPMGDDQSFFQTFYITSLRIADGKSLMMINQDTIELFSDYYPLSYSANQAQAASGIVDVSFGIYSDKRNDYLNKDVKGSIAMINVGSPDGVHPHSEFLAWHGINIRVDEASKRGAKGVIFYRTSEKTAVPASDLSLEMKPSGIPVVFLVRPLPEPISIAFATIEIQILTDAEAGHNVIGYKDNGAQTTVVIGAHHDHLGRGEHGNSIGENTYEVHNGADDNASGVAALLELARKLRKSKKWNRENNYLFIAFSGEEMGLVGSKYFVENPSHSMENINYMLNMDMVGMLDSVSKTLIVNGIGTGDLWKAGIEALGNNQKGISLVKTTESGIGPSDHTSFYLKGIPAIHFFTGVHPHYHKPSDDVANLNIAGEVFVVNYILNLVGELNGKGRQKFTPTTGADSISRSSSRSSFTVTLGIVPNYTYDGEGLQVDAVRDGKAGQKAGILAGDVIVSFNQEPVKNIGDYMQILSTLKEGAHSTVAVQRGDKVLTFEVQF